MATSIAQQSFPALEQVLSQLKGVRTSMRGWRACCPAHTDRKPSLSISLGEHGQVLLKCFAGCSFDHATVSEQHWLPKRDRAGARAKGRSCPMVWDDWRRPEKRATWC